MSLDEAIAARKKRLHMLDGEDYDEKDAIPELERQTHDEPAEKENDIFGGISVESQMDSLKLMTPKKKKKQQKITNFYKKEAKSEP